MAAVPLLQAAEMANGRDEVKRGAIIELFAELQHSPRHLLPSPVYSLYSEQDTQTGQMRVICDYIASLTDAGLVRVYKRLFDPGAGSVFDNLR